MKKVSQVNINMIANVLSFAVATFISFYTTPYITKNVGMEAYGLIGLANNFANYITIITAALNSMASRFIVIELHNNNSKEATAFFNSALFANTFLAGIIIVLTLVLIPNLGCIINVSDTLLFDAQMTFLIVLVTFAFSLMTSVFGVVFYAKNRLDLGAWRTVESNIMRAILLVLVFNFIGVKIQYTVAITFVSSIYVSGFSLYYIRKMLPEIKIHRKYFDIRKIWVLVKSGMWNSISKLSQILLDGLDLIITNLFIGGSILGCVSVAKTFSTMIISLISTVSDVYLPKFFKAYTKGQETLNQQFLSSTKMLGLCSSILLGVFAAYCKDFYIFWLPGEDAVLLQNLTFISLVSIAISGSIYPMFSLFTVINKVKEQAIANLIMGVLSTVTVFVLLQVSDLGVYAIVGVSAVYGACKNLFYNIPYLSKHAGIQPKKVYVIVLKNIMMLGVVFVVAKIINNTFMVENMAGLVMSGLVAAFVALIVYVVLGTSIQSKKDICCKIRRVIRK